jgi:hypothetical protein
VAFDQGWAQGLADRGGDAAILHAFPTGQIVRVMCGYGTGTSVGGNETFENMQASVTNLTNAGMVVVFVYFSYGYSASGGELTQVCDNMAAMAAGFKDNPRVWFGGQNEPASNGWAPMELAMYQAIRNAGNTQPFAVLLGGDEMGDDGTDISIFSQMENCFFDNHFYHWVTNAGAPFAGMTMDEVVSQSVARRKAATGLDWPTICLEYGNSTDGNTVDDPNNEVTNAVNNAVTAGTLQGCSAWAVLGASSNADNLTTDDAGTLQTPFGTAVRGFMPP